MTDHNLTPEQESKIRQAIEDIVQEKVNELLDSKFPEHWVLALEFVKKFSQEVEAYNHNYLDMVKLFQSLIV
jgi:ribosomal protein S3AE